MFAVNSQQQSEKQRSGLVRLVYVSACVMTSVNDPLTASFPDYIPNAVLLWLNLLCRAERGLKKLSSKESMP
jgi:hypothetical protein